MDVPVVVYRFIAWLPAASDVSSTVAGVGAQRQGHGSRSSGSRPGRSGNPFPQ
jgi:hypothetical protein